VAVPQQRVDEMTADEAGAAGDQYVPHIRHQFLKRAISLKSCCKGGVESNDTNVKSDESVVEARSLWSADYRPLSHMTVFRMC
jgi:hypothetical protein